MLTRSLLYTICKWIMASSDKLFGLIYCFSFKKLSETYFNITITIISKYGITPLKWQQNQRPYFYS